MSVIVPGKVIGILGDDILKCRCAAPLYDLLIFPFYKGVETFFKTTIESGGKQPLVLYNLKILITCLFLLYKLAPLRRPPQYQPHHPPLHCRPPLHPRRPSTQTPHRPQNDWRSAGIRGCYT